MFADEALQADREGVLLVVQQERRGEGDLAEGGDEAVERGDREPGPGQRQDQPQEGAEGAEAVDAAGLVDLDGGDGVEVAFISQAQYGTVVEQLTRMSAP